MLLRAVSRFYTLKFHSTSPFDAVGRGLCSVNFGLTKTFNNDPCCVGSSTKSVAWVSPRNTASLLTFTLEGGNYITYSIELLHSHIALLIY